MQIPRLKIGLEPLPRYCQDFDQILKILSMKPSILYLFIHKISISKFISRILIHCPTHPRKIMAHQSNGPKAIDTLHYSRCLRKVGVNSGIFRILTGSWTDRNCRPNR